MRRVGNGKTKIGHAKMEGRKTCMDNVGASCWPEGVVEAAGPRVLFFPQTYGERKEVDARTQEDEKESE